jgi:putative hydrolase of the HAD superfamily
MLRSTAAKQIQAVIFDLDGVVVFPWRFAQYLEREHGIMRADTKDFFDGPFLPCLRGEKDVKEVLPPFLQRWQWPETVDDFVRIWLESENCPDTRLLALIEQLRRGGWTCGLGTNQERHRAEFIRKKMSFERLFDHLFISCEMGTIKPELTYFQTARDILDCPAQSILFIDNEQHYIDAARNAGWNAKLFVSFEDLFDDTSEFFFTPLS